MKRKGQPKRRKGKPGVGRQRGGITPMLAAGGKAVVLGGLSALTKFGTRKAIQALEKKKYKRKRRQRTQRKK